MYTEQQIVEMTERRANYTKAQNEAALNNVEARKLIGQTYSEPESEKEFEVQDYIWDDFHNRFFYICLENTSKRTYHISDDVEGVRGYLAENKWILKK